MRFAAKFAIVLLLMGCSQKQDSKVAVSSGELTPVPSLPKSWRSNGNVQLAIEYQLRQPDGSERPLLLVESPKTLAPLVMVQFMREDGPIGEPIRLGTEADC